MKRKQKEVLALLGVGVVASIVPFTTTDVLFDLKHKGHPTQSQLQKAFPGNSQQILDESDELTLFSLDPGSNPGEDENQERGNKLFFHGYRVVAQTTLRTREKSRLLRTFYSGIADDVSPMACFGPNHGFRASRAGQNVDVVICFGCQQLLTYSRAGKGFATISPAPGDYFKSVISSVVPLGSR